MTQEPDYYAALGVDPDADEAAIRLAFRRLARRYHPDVAGSGSDEKMRQLNAAYHVLSDPEQRQLYDLGRGIPQKSAPPTAPAPPSASTAPPPHPRPRATQAPPPQTSEAPASYAGMLHVSDGPLQRVAVLERRDTTPIVALSLAAGGRFLASGLLDGRVVIWDIIARQPIRTLTFGERPTLGVLQDVRLSPTGALAAAWGFQLGTRVWQVADGRTLWNAGIHGPAGVMDLQLTDAPPLVRLALPGAPIALADDDPFRWAYEGRWSSAILTRPLLGPVDPVWAIPLQCDEVPERHRFGPDVGGRWRIHERLLAEDGRRLLTFSTGAAGRISSARILALWELEHRSLTGVAQPRRVVQMAEPAEHLEFPLAATPDLEHVAVGFRAAAMRVSALRTGKSTVLTTGPVPEDALAALSPEGVYLGLADDRSLTLWELRTAAPAQRWSCAAEITALTCRMAAGRPCWAVGLSNGFVEVWA